MNILYIHSNYQVRGGEDNVFDQELVLISKRYDVKSLVFCNRSGLIGAIQFIISIYNVLIFRNLKSTIKKFKPDIIHIHNWHYASGPIIVRVAKNTGIPVVITVHNYRLLCPSGSLMDKERLFLDSINSAFPWSAVFKKVFRSSYLMTFWLAFVVWFHKKIGTWNLVNKYIVLTEFSKKIHTESSLGVEASKFVVKPNFIENSRYEFRDRKPYFLYVGRLSEEKGIEVVLSTFQGSNYKVKIAGDGPSVERVKKVSAECNNIEYLGILNKENVRQAMQECTALLFPSIWYEGMPMVILEAFSLGTPVIASNFGVMTSMIQHGINGMHFDVGNPQALRTALDHWDSLTHEERQAYSMSARATYEQHYTPEANYKLFMEIYQSVLDQKAVRETGV